MYFQSMITLLISRILHRRKDIAGITMRLGFICVRAAILLQALFFSDILWAAEREIIKITDVDEGQVSDPWHSKISFLFGPSYPPKGETAKFRVQGSIFVYIKRDGVLKGNAKVHMSLKNSHGKLEGSWVLQPPFYKILEFPISQKYTLEINVVDDIGAGVLRESPIKFVAYPIKENSFISLKSGISWERRNESFSPVCRGVVALDETLISLIPFTNVPAGKTAPDIVNVSFLQAGRILVLKLPKYTKGKKESFKIRIFSKRFQTWEFIPICKDLKVTLKKVESHIVAFSPTLPIHTQGNIWRVEVTRLTKDNENAIGESITLFREPWEYTSPQPMSFFLNDGYLCIKPRKYDGFKAEGADSFGGRIVLNVNLDFSEVSPSEQQIGEVTQLILRAVALWVQACNSCRPDHMLIIKINEQVYVDWNINALADSELRKGNSLVPYKSMLELEKYLSNTFNGLSLYPGLPSTFPTTGKIWRQNFMLMPHAPLNEKFQILCGMRPSKADTSLLFNIHKAVCAPELLSATDLSEIAVRFVKGKTYCGNDINTIACRADDTLTEYNVRDYRFKFDDSSLPAIGDGQTEVDMLHVILHEMGHWIGLPHFDENESVMASSMQKSRCIDSSTLEAINDKAVRLKFEKERKRPLAFKLR